MRFRFPFLVILLFLSAPSFAESMDDLVERDGLYYKKFTDVPFTGKIESKLMKGSMKNGKPVGDWIGYHENGQLHFKGLHNENGEREGLWVEYRENGRLRMKGELKNGKREGYWEAYLPTGGIDPVNAGTFKNDKKISD